MPSVDATRKRVQFAERWGRSSLRVVTWQPGDELRAAGNVRYRVTAVIPIERVAEFIDRPLVGILEVESL